jgi:hypothetical protein
MIPLLTQVYGGDTYDAGRPASLARLEGSLWASQLADPSLAGFAAQLLGAVSGLFANALSFLVSAACLSRRTTFPPICRAATAAWSASCSRHPAIRGGGRRRHRRELRPAPPAPRSPHPPPRCRRADHRTLDGMRPDGPATGRRFLTQSAYPDDRHLRARMAAAAAESSSAAYPGRLVSGWILDPSPGRW